MLHRMLVPLDGSELSNAILPHAASLAKKLDLPVVLMTVIDPDHRDEENEIFGSVVDASLEGPDLEREITNRLESAASRFGEEHQLSTRVVVVEGDPADEIVSVARSEECDVIAIATHGRNVLKRTVLGSVSDKVVRISHIPTLVIAPHAAERYHQDSSNITRVLVPLDGTSFSEAALPYVEFLARQLDLDITLVRDVDRYGGYRGFPTADSSEILDHAAEDYLERTAETLRQKGLRANWTVTHGRPPSAIVDVARHAQNDIIVTVTHGRSGFSRLLHDSVAEAAVRASGDPVLVLSWEPDSQP